MHAPGAAIVVMKATAESGWSCPRRCGCLRIFVPTPISFARASWKGHPLRDDSSRPAEVADGNPVERVKPLDVSFEQQASNELGKLVWKLHWLGEEEEAHKAQMQRARILARLELFRIPYAHIAMLNDTD